MPKYRFALRQERVRYVLIEADDKPKAIQIFQKGGGVEEGEDVLDETCEYDYDVEEVVNE